MFYLIYSAILQHVTGYLVLTVRVSRDRAKKSERDRCDSGQFACPQKKKKCVRTHTPLFEPQALIVYTLEHFRMSKIITFICCFVLCLYWTLWVTR